MSQQTRPDLHALVTSSAVAAPFADPIEPSLPLADLPARRAAVVVALQGDDLLVQRLTACGLWPGAQVERIGKAPFGDPLLFRLHGYRLALRSSEAKIVLVREARQ